MIKKLFEKPLQNYFLLTNKQLLDSKQSIQAFISYLQSDQNKAASIHMDSVSLSEKDAEMRMKAHQICSDHLGGVWSKIAPNDLSLIPISGGMSNSIFCCSLPESFASSEDIPAQVLLRFYGKTVRDSDITMQLKIFSLLSVKNLGPKLYGKFDKGRLEEFLPATSITCEEIADLNISSIIAKKLAAIHSLDIPIDKERSWLLDRLNEWINYINENRDDFSFDHEIRPSTMKAAQELLSIDFNKELLLIRQLFNKTQSPSVFSHNDLHQGNILLVRNSKRRTNLEDRVVIIDFEYSSYNYRAYDIANHFVEWCFEYDTPDYPHFKLDEGRFPSIKKQYNFLNSYLEETELANNSTNTTLHAQNINDTNHQCGDKLVGNGFHTNGHPNTILNQSKLQDLIKEIEPFFMVSNLLWTVWCIKSANTSSIKFGYWEHAQARWKLYSIFKAAHFDDTHTNAGNVEN